MNNDYPVRVGELRPSQLIWAFGVGALVDLPHISVVVNGLDYWDTGRSIPLMEARLLRAVQKTLGQQVKRLLAPPIEPETSGPFNPFDSGPGIGAPVTPFPRWLRCPKCGSLAEYDSGLFELKPDPYRPDKTRFVHSNCQKAKGISPTAVPARFLVACRKGHLDDFPWHWYVHGGPSDCPGSLKFYERGASLQSTDLYVECMNETCRARKPMVHAFGENAKNHLPGCRGRHPHLGQCSGDCDEKLHGVLLGASNSWFPITMTALAMPSEKDKLGQMVDDSWELLEKIPSREVLPIVIEPLMLAGQLPGFDQFDYDTIWEVMEEKRAEDEGNENDDEGIDFKTPEWEVFTRPDPPSDWPDFMARKVDPPRHFREEVKAVLLVERLREVNALIGFTRVDPPEEGKEGGKPPPRAPLSNVRPEWVPATEVRGEGIFIRFDENLLEDWLSKDAIKTRETELLDGHRAWRTARRLDPNTNFPGMVYVMLHSLAHILLRELSLECGYNAASIRERVYASGHNEPVTMAGILLYTAAPDSDGTLGGLVDLGKPENLERLMSQAFARARICSSDPLCAEHEPAKDRTLHGAACHACLFVSETSCEIGNRYLDRALLVPTLQRADLAFFVEMET